MADRFKYSEVRQKIIEAIWLLIIINSENCVRIR